MKNEGLNNCCCESTAGLTVIEGNSCPVCKTLGSRVKRVTVEHLVLESLRESVGDRDFYLCRMRNVILSITTRKQVLANNK